MRFDFKTNPWTLVALMLLLALITLGYRLATGL